VTAFDSAGLPSDMAIREVCERVTGLLGGAPNFKGWTYFREYLALIRAERLHVSTLVELGIAEGASLLVWSQLLPQALCVGVDRHWSPALEEILERERLTSRIRLVAGDHEQPGNFGDRLPREIDLLIDDGSHLLEPTRKCFRALFDRVRSGGWYCIEDWGAGYWESFGGPDQGVHRILYEFIDELAIEDRCKEEAGEARVPQRDRTMEELRVRGVEPIAFLKKR